VNRTHVLDGNLVSARTWHDNAPLMHEFMRMLGATDTAEPSGGDGVKGKVVLTRGEPIRRRASAKK
jgi:hypothetical protein